MRAVDATFVVDLLKAEPAAVKRARELALDPDGTAIPSPALAAVLRGAYHAGGGLLQRTTRLVEDFHTLSVDAQVAHEAGRIGAEMQQRGRPMATGDLLIAAVCRVHGVSLLTRDSGFGRVPGLAVEAY